MVNEDIKFLWSDMALDFQSYNRQSWFVNQIHQINAERQMLIKLRETEEKTDVKIRISRMILEINEKLVNFGAKFIENQAQIISEDDIIEDEIVQKVVMYLINDHL